MNRSRPARRVTHDGDRNDRREVGELPVDGSTVHVRLWTLLGGTWRFTDARYTASRPTLAEPSRMVRPAPGAQLTDTTVTFEWLAVAGASEHWLYVGSTPGGLDYYSKSMGTATALTLFGLPSDGSTLYVRIWTKQNGSWRFTDGEYTATTLDELFGFLF